ncbi:CU044_5270 family protein [Streptomyces avermitilis]|uniref:CU044_5270 family protein n=1 Tax=Streptomyces avermitilis TaxID=33903 RepID=UPI0033B73E1C
MDEMNRVRELRADAPTPDRGRLAPGRMRLVETARTGERRRAMWARREFVIAGVVAAVTAVAVTASMLADGGDQGRKASPAVSPNLNLKGLSARELLERAATVLETQPPVAVPEAKQWIYTKSMSEGQDPKLLKEMGEEAFVQENWIRYDGSASAYLLPVKGSKLQITKMHLENGGEGDDRSPREMYRFLSTLPTDGEGALKTLREENAIADGKESQAEADRTEIFVLLSADVVPPKGLAGLYRALATLPGGKVTDHLVKNAAGRRVIALHYGGDGIGSGGQDWLLDPQTFQVVGQRLYAGKGGVDGGKGAVEGGNSLITRAVVDKAGRRS